MNFFNAQDAARRNTTRLVVLFTVAVVTLVVLTNLLIAFTVIWFGGYSQSLSAAESLTLLPTRYWLWIALGVTAVVAAASAFKYLMISGGGRDIAEGLGGTLVAPNTQEPSQRRLLNVVEEMAIASGIAVPPVYLLDEIGINAFAAGFSPDDAVIGVTRGAIDQLSRDELQAVIGHEFSHVFNGDMRINLRLIAILHGILFIGLVGYALLRGGRHGGRNAAPLLLLAGGLVAIGFAGTFCGRLIKAGVSRQREYLADAASVQFTRNPTGMAGALKKIGATTAELVTRRAAEASHMFFADAIRHTVAGLTATHPPIEKRIRAIEPNWDGTYPSPRVGVAPGTTTEQGTGSLGSLLDTLQNTANWDKTGASSMTNFAAIEAVVGQPQAETIAVARALIDSTDDIAREAAHDPWGARALIYGLVLSGQTTMRDAQLEYVLQNADKGVPQFLSRLVASLADHDLQHRLALVELAIPALKTLSDSQYRRFMENLQALVKMDRRIDLHEWVLYRILVKELTPHFDGPRRTRATLADAVHAPVAAATLMSSLARQSTEPHRQVAAFERGMNVLELQSAFQSRDDDNFTELNAALRELRRLKPLAKPKLLKACVACVTADGVVCPNEAALLQGIAAALDCPLPPMINVGPSEASAAGVTRQ